MEAGAIYTCISFAPGRRHVPVARDGSLSPTTWLLQKANHFKSRKQESRKKRGTACAFAVQHPFVLYEQNKKSHETQQQPGDTTWGFYQAGAGSK